MIIAKGCDANCLGCLTSHAQIKCPGGLNLSKIVNYERVPKKLSFMSDSLRGFFDKDIQ